MTKDEKGITIVSLAITVIVMIIILGVTLVSGTSLLEHSKLTKIETSLLLIKARAETLAEQYGFDGNLASVLSFSKLEDNYVKPMVYNYSPNRISIGYKTSSGRYVGINYQNSNFDDLVNKIYGYKNMGNVYVKTWTGSDYVGISIDRFLYVKWGLDECISQGIIKETDTKQTVINNSDKYAIVQYDLKEGNVTSIAYSLGFRNKDNVIEYTLNDLLQIDIDGE